MSVMDFLDERSGPHSWGVFPALKALKKADAGVLVLLHKAETSEALRARALDGKSPSASPMELRDFGIGAQILRDLNVRKMRLLSRPRKMPSMTGWGLEVTGYEEMQD
jgi:3,4-dihydroxy 2-butanone 4-phosphate synthase/GTP cyclohydrolase II